MDALRQDLRFAVRLLWKDRAFAIATILTLALCLGANSAIFTVVRSVLLRPLSYPEANRLVFSYDAFPGAGVERAGTSVPNYFDRAQMTDVFDSVALYQWWGYGVGQGGGAEQVSAMRVTPSFFRVLRGGTMRGRVFTEEEATPGKEKVAIVSQAFAEKQPEGIAGIVGKQLRLNDELHVVVGVMPATFSFLSPEVRVFTPLAFTAEQRSEEARHSQNHQQIARLAPGATIQQAQSRVDALNVAIVERSGALKQALINARYSTVMVPLDADLVRNVRAALQLLWGGVLFVLLIAAVNLTNLSLVRASGRVKELATRSALGAGSGRVVRQLVTESIVLTILGGAAGLLVGYWSLDAIEWLGLTDLPRAHEIRMDGTVLGFTLGLATLLGVVVGAVPAWHLSHQNLNRILQEEGRGGSVGPGARFARRALVVAQVGTAFVLLIGAGLLLASFRQLLNVDPGFVAQHVLTGRANPLETRYPDDAALRSYTSRVLERIRALPGVQAAGATSYLPFSWDESSSVVVPEGYVMSPGESVVSPNQVVVTPGYLEALRVKVKRGRFFTDSDAPDAPRVVLVDEQLAKHFWPKTDPLGRRMYLPGRVEDLANPGPNVTWMQVVGVVADVKMRGLVEGEGARVGTYYMPYAQYPSRGVALAIRTTGDPIAATTAVQRALASIDPEAQLTDTFTMSDRVEKSLNPRRAPMLLSMAFGAVALLLASIGIYGVLAYQVAQRTREIGIRMALGSGTREIMRMVLGEGLALVLVGLVVGATLALLLRSYIASQLYGVGTLDPGVILGVTGVLALASLLACLGPARRAAGVNPIIALSRQ